MSTLSETKANLEKFLKDNPKAQKYQDEIDDILSRVPDDARLETIQLLLAGKLRELGEVMSCLVAKGPNI